MNKPWHHAFRVMHRMLERFVQKVAAPTLKSNFTKESLRELKYYQSENQQNVMFLVKHSQVNEYMVGPGRIAIAAKKNWRNSIVPNLPEGEVRIFWSFEFTNETGFSAVIWGLCVPQKLGENGDTPPTPPKESSSFCSCKIGISCHFRPLGSRKIISTSTHLTLHLTQLKHWTCLSCFKKTTDI